MKHILFIILFMASAAPSFAQTKSEPLEITAAESLDWDRENKTFTAIKDALATQGGASIASHKLIASYRDAQDKNFDIWKIEADQNVIITSETSKAYGDHAVYNLDEGLAVMTGNNLRLISPEQTVTARDRFEYYVTQGQLKAYGQAKVVRLEDTLEADLIIAYMHEDSEGKQVLDKLEAQGHVIITTATETAEGNAGIYRADTNKATLLGDVTIRRGPNILEGEKAEIDLTTNTSRMFGDTTGANRVRGVFYPDSEKTEEEGL